MNKIIVCLLFWINIVFCYGQPSKNILRVKPGDNLISLNSVINKYKGKDLEIILSKGNFFLSGILELNNDNLTLTSENGGVDINMASNSGVVIRGNNIKISNLRFAGNGQSSIDLYTGSAIMVLGSNDVEIVNNIFYKISGNGINIFPRGSIGASNILIANNKFLNPVFKLFSGGDNSAILIGYSGKGYSHKNIDLYKNYIDGANVLNNGVSVIGHGSNISVRNNIIKNLLSYGVVLYESDNDPFSLEKNEVSENIISNIGEVGEKKTKKGMGIYLMKSHNTIVKGNRLTNVMRNSDKSETLVSAAIGLNGVQGGKVLNNIIVSSNMYGIVPAYSFNTIISENTFITTVKHNVYFISCSDLLVSKNVFSNKSNNFLRGYISKTTAQSDLPNNVKNINTGFNIVIENNIFDSKFSTLDIINKIESYNALGNIKIKSNVVKNEGVAHELNIVVRKR